MKKKGMKEMEKTLGIIGGMGPAATVQLFHKVVELTNALKDQDHLNILIYNNARIPDRTAFLMGKGEDPRRELVHTAQLLESMGADYLIMPCNTAHAFYDVIQKEISIPLLHMIEETAGLVNHTYPHIKRIGLMATDGTLHSRIYNKVFSNYDIEVIEPTDSMQKKVMELIFTIKSGTLDENIFLEVHEEFKNRRVDVIILGCTELSVLHGHYHFNGDIIDPLEIIARKAVVVGERQVKVLELSGAGA